MTPGREAQIRKRAGEASFVGHALLDLFAELDNLRTAAEPFLHGSARLVSQSTDGKAYMAIEVTIDDILNLRKVLKGS